MNGSARCKVAISLRRDVARMMWKVAFTGVKRIRIMTPLPLGEVGRGSGRERDSFPWHNRVSRVPTQSKPSPGPESPTSPASGRGNIRLRSGIVSAERDCNVVRSWLFALLFCLVSPAIADEASSHSLDWSELPSLPNEVGVAGPFAGVHNDALIVAGGANFAPPVWDNDKEWHDEIYVLTRDGDKFFWKDGGKLTKPTGYGAAVSSSAGVICMGGNDAGEVFDDVFSLQVDPDTGDVTQTELAITALPLCVWFGNGDWRCGVFDRWPKRADARYRDEQRLVAGSCQSRRRCGFSVDRA